MSSALIISNEQSLSLQNIKQVIELLDEGATIPFIARYRKERTGNLDEVLIQQIKQRFEELKEMAIRKATIFLTM